MIPNVLWKSIASYSSYKELVTLTCTSKVGQKAALAVPEFKELKRLQEEELAAAFPQFLQKFYDLIQIDYYSAPHCVQVTKLVGNKGKKQDIITLLGIKWCSSTRFSLFCRQQFFDLWSLHYSVKKTITLPLQAKNLSKSALAVDSKDDKDYPKATPATVQRVDLLKSQEDIKCRIKCWQDFDITQETGLKLRKKLQLSTLEPITMIALPLLVCLVGPRDIASVAARLGILALATIAASKFYNRNSLT